MNNNASLNAQRLLNLMLQTACPCDSTVPLLSPPLDTLPTDLEADAKCQRIQYFLDLFASWAIQCVVYLAGNGTISSFQIDNLLALTFESISLEDDNIRPIPTGTRDFISTALNSSGDPSAINASVFDNITNGTVIADMRQALYAQDNAADGSNAAKNAIDMTGGPYANVISSMFYSGWANAMYGALPVVDASGYDGSICAPTPDCDNGTSLLYSSDAGATFPYYGAVWPSGYTVGSTDFDGIHYSHNLFFTGDADGYTFRLLTGTNVSLGAWTGTTGAIVTRYFGDLTSTPVTISGSTSIITIYALAADGAFTFEVCPALL
jgi:hypothetical protein